MDALTARREYQQRHRLPAGCSAAADLSPYLCKHVLSFGTSRGIARQRRVEIGPPPDVAHRATSTHDAYARLTVQRDETINDDTRRDPVSDNYRKVSCIADWYPQSRIAEVRRQHHGQHTAVVGGPFDLLPTQSGVAGGGSLHVQRGVRGNHQASRAIVYPRQDALLRGEVQKLTNLVIKCGSTPPHLSIAAFSLATKRVLVDLAALRLQLHKVGKHCRIGDRVLGLQSLHP